MNRLPEVPIDPQAPLAAGHIDAHQALVDHIVALEERVGDLERQLRLLLEVGGID